LCTICARGGSKGVPGKNIRPLAGKPLLRHSIDQARASGLFAAIAVSSDDPAILAVAREAGVEVLVERPAELASDTAGKMPAIRHCVDSAEHALGRRFDTVVDLDATSPLRLPEDIAGAVALLEDAGVSCVITGSPARRSPYFNLVEQRPDGSVGVAKPPPATVLRRQDAPPCFDMNASIYVWRRDVLLADPRVFYPDTRLYVMPEERSHDIDSPLDFDLVTFLISRRPQP
jgi:N-acylneuraminate cytidylyltransferase/CMP-N,N'-diacetyllegionaminic acid synthase